MTRLGFGVDTSACTGCKACQAACKDRNGLPVGVLWRRVYEISGGSWRREGEAWRHDVWAYSLSVSCNHCEEPICLEVCPSNAYTKRDNGIVAHDPARCLGCGNCAWACPYGAPQLDPARGVMTKCNLCEEELAAGRAPACVAACPLRVLEVGDREELAARFGPPDMVPLPDPGLTTPSLRLRAHPHAGRARAEGGRVRNREEVGE
ncbi:MAG TPA: dimethylsulfoxide reductase subunit B [Thermoanaerobaculaceae bacterium]|nr:dimethylsulfoxide reductase subunit B [Thermoanaerobaculaceae bacterium]HRS16902.1 dimethylsulfoxide reductase subunit B [Thermoanaerobaculaceae bacterium]